MTEITMPRLSDQMEQGTIVAWLVQDGQRVSPGDEIAEIETDKATMSHEAVAEGVIEIVAPVGATLAVGEVIARIGERTAAPAHAAPAAPAVPAAPAAPAVNGNGGAPAVATPLARRVANVHGVELAGLAGTGPRGRVTKSDVLRAAGIAPEPVAEPPAAPPAPAPAPAAAPPPPAPTAPGAKGDSELRTPTRLQQVVARRMAEAKATVPHFQVQTEVVLDAAIALRAELKQLAGDDPVPSLNDIIVRASALALRRHPLVNGSYRDGSYELHSRVNVGIAVASDEGLVVVTVPDADIKSLGQVARESRRLAARVRDGSITPPELAGATFTVSNLGMFGMTAITAVINPPQAAILGVGAARPVLARDGDGAIIERQMLTLTLSCDHRILNGADGSRYLHEVKELLEAPLKAAL